MCGGSRDEIYQHLLAKRVFSKSSTRHRATLINVSVSAYGCHATPSHHAWKSLLPLPRTNTSIWLAAREMDAGADVITPPKLVQSDHLTPPSSEHLCHTALSVPRTNTSKRWGPQEDTLGSDSGSDEICPPNGPPKDSQFCQPPSYHPCHSALSIPRANT